MSARTRLSRRLSACVHLSDSLSACRTSGMFVRSERVRWWVPDVNASAYCANTILISDSAFHAPVLISFQALCVLGQISAFRTPSRISAIWAENTTRKPRTRLEKDWLHAYSSRFAQFVAFFHGGVGLPSKTLTPLLPLSLNVATLGFFKVVSGRCTGNFKVQP